MEPAPVKPRLRGVSHQIAFFAVLPLGVLLAWRAAASFRLAVVVYAATLAAQLGASALYHRPSWDPAARRWMRRCDHAAIFLLIAGTATPIAYTLDPASRTRLLLILWIGAALGVLRAMLWITAPKWLAAALAMAVGWGCLPFLPALSRAIDAWTLALVVGGGALYSVGGAIYALRRPDPWPQIFGYHELFHALTIISAACHFVAIERVARI